MIRIKFGTNPSLTYRKADRFIPGQTASASMRLMSRPVPDKAEVALEYPDKFYVGTFEHSSRFEARLDGSGVALVLQHPGAADERKSVHLHINFGLLAGILRELAGSVAALPKDDIAHREQLADALDELRRALRSS